MRRVEREGYGNGTQGSQDTVYNSCFGSSCAASIRQSPAQLSGMEERMTAVTTKSVICVTLICHV